MTTNIHYWSYLAHFFLEWETFQTKVVEKIKTHILCSVPFFNHVFYEIIWNNIVERGRPHMAMWRMWIACSIPEATNTHSEYTILLLFHCNNGCMEAPQCYVIRTLPVSLFLQRQRKFANPRSTDPRKEWDECTTHDNTPSRHTHTSFPLMSWISYIVIYMYVDRHM
jgi:hypothetical protein